MKRSAGVLAVSIILILTGLFGAWTSLLPAVNGPAMISPDQVDAQLQAFLESTDRDDQVLSIDQEEQLRGIFRDLVARMQAYFAQPVVRVVYGLAGLIALAACLSGIGLLIKAPWARPSVMAQAAASMVVTTWSIIMASGFQGEMAQIISRAVGDPAAEATFYRAAQMMRLAGLIMNVVLVVGWNGFLWWWATRPTVKAQLDARTPGASAGAA